MPNAIQTNYTGGLLAPGISARTDLDKYYNGCARLENMIVLNQGAATRRGGSRFRAATKYPDKDALLVEFIYSTVQAYLLEVGDYYIRFYMQGGQIQASGGGPYEVATPFAEADLNKLNFSQSTDTLFITGGSGLYRLVRFGHNDWRLQVLRIDQPPLAPDEYYPPGTLTPTALTINEILLTASSPVFLTGDVGCVIKRKNGPGQALITTSIANPAATLTPAAISGSNIRFRASTAYFLPAQIGCEIKVISGTGKATITAFIEEYYPAFLLTPAGTSGSGIHFYVDSAFFTSDHVDCELEAKNGVGRARITAVLNNTEVVCTILTNFASTDPIAAGDWLLLGNYSTGLLPAGAVPEADSFSINADISEAFANLTPVPSGNWLLALGSGGAGSAYQVIAQIIDDFDDEAPIVSGDWVLMGGPRQGELSYMSAIYNSGVLSQQYYTQGTPISLNCNSDIFRASDVGKFSRILGGCIEITSFVTARQVQAIIRRDLPLTSAVNIKFGYLTIESAAWSATRGWPWFLAFHKNRLIAAGSNSQPETVWGSESGNLYNFLTGSQDGDPFEFTLAGDQVKAAQWLIPAKKLFLGTPSGEFVYPAGDQPPGPNNPNLEEQTSIGCRRLRAVKRDNLVFFVADITNHLHSLTYQLNSDGFVATDLNIMADHLVKGRNIISLAATKGPQAIIWAVRDDNRLLGLSFQQQQNVAAWHEHPMLNGLVERVACIPGSNGYETWLLVRRTINGQTVKYLETIEDYQFDTLADAFFVDCGLSYTGPPTTIITGLGHLEGETVAILADGAVAPMQIVSGGQIVLSRAASKVQVGLPMVSRLQHMPLAAPGSLNSINETEKAVSAVILRLYQSAGFKIGPDEDHLESAYFRQVGDPMGSPPPLFTGPKQVNYAAGYTKEVQPLIIQDQPLPLTVLGAVIKFDLADQD